MKHGEIEAGKVYAIDPEGGGQSSNASQNDPERNRGKGTKAKAIEPTAGHMVYGRPRTGKGWRFELLEPVNGYRTLAEGDTVDLPSRAVHREWTEADDARRGEWQAQREADARLYERLFALGVPRKLTPRRFAAAEGDSKQGAVIERGGARVAIDREVLEGLLDRVEGLLASTEALLP